MNEIFRFPSILQSRIQIAKMFFPAHSFMITEADKDVWNTFIEQLGENHTYFSVKWLHAECYLYRRLRSIFEQT